MIPNIYPGYFFVVEGIDGCGKTEQFKKLLDYLRAKRSTAIGTKEPGKNRVYGAEIYRDLHDPNGLHKTDPFRFQMLYAMDSKEHLRSEIVPRLRAGCNVVSDRFRPSMVYGVRPPHPEWFRNVLNRPSPTEKARIVLSKLMEMTQAIIGEDFIWPDAIFIFDVPDTVAIQRLKEKGKILDGHENLAVLNATRMSYGIFGSIYPNCHLIDGNRDPESVFEDVRKIVELILESRRDKSSHIL
jgi:thymidylate kinase